MSYLPPGLPAPVTESDKLDLPYWEGHAPGRAEGAALRRLQYLAVGAGMALPSLPVVGHALGRGRGRGQIWTWTRCWHPVHPALKDHGPYIAVLVELPHAGNVRMLGNLLGDPRQEVTIGAAVEAVFEPHDDAATPYTLVQWRTAIGRRIA